MRRKTIARMVTGLILGGLVLVTAFVFGLHPFLSHHAPLPQADALVVEGWLPQSTFPLVTRELARAAAVGHPYRYVVTTGVNGFIDYRVYPQGEFRATVRSTHAGTPGGPALALAFEAFGGAFLNVFPRVLVKVNGVVVDTVTTSHDRTTYRVSVPDSLLPVRSVAFFFDDYTPYAQARTLYVGRVWLGGQPIEAFADQMAFHYTSGPVPTREIASRSFADRARQILIRLGVDSARVVAVPTHVPADRSRTFSSAVSFGAWLHHHPDVKRVNLFSLGAHARRSHLSYARALGDTIAMLEAKFTMRTYVKGKPSAEDSTHAP